MERAVPEEKMFINHVNRFRGLGSPEIFENNFDFPLNNLNYKVKPLLCFISALYLCYYRDGQISSIDYI